MGNAMRKPLVVAFLIAIMVGGLAFAGIAYISSVKASTEVIGIIDSDTIWTKANSPYNLTGNVLIDSGVTVTVEADAVVNLDSYYIRVNGTLIIQPGVTINMKTMDASIQVNGVLNARGTSENPIHINGAVGYIALFVPPSYSAIGFSQSSTGWNEQTGAGSIIEYATINSTFISIESSPRLHNNIIDTAISVSSGSPTISNNVITSRIDISSGSPVIANNRIVGGYITFYDEGEGEDATIINNIISDSKSLSGIASGITFAGSWGYGGHVLVERNLITDCTTAVEIIQPNYDVFRTSFTIQKNTITNNDVGISITDRCAPTINYNNIYNNNMSLSLSREASSDIDATNNWWGTTDTTSISQFIHDFEDDFNLGKVTFIPFLTSPTPNASPDLNAPIPTPKPEQTPAASPTPTPEQTPTSTPSQEPQQTDETEAIIGAAIAATVFGAGLGLLIYLIKRK